MLATQNSSDFQNGGRFSKWPPKTYADKLKQCSMKGTLIKFGRNTADGVLYPGIILPTQSLPEIQNGGQVSRWPPNETHTFVNGQI